MSLMGLIQMNSGANVAENMIFLKEQLKTLKKQGAQLVVTPENTLIFATKKDYAFYAESLGSGPLQDELSECVKGLGLWLILGSFPIRNDDGTISSTCLVFDDKGALYAFYKKLHLFDVSVSDEHGAYRESDIFKAGEAFSLVETPFGKIGLSICYDLRFPLLYSMLREEGADIIVVPAAFTKVTGLAHWEVLLRARAIETQCWVLAPGQCGRHSEGRETYGHSMILDPWGGIASQLEDQPGLLLSKINVEKNKRIRNKMPTSYQSRFQCRLK